MLSSPVAPMAVCLGIRRGLAAICTTWICFLASEKCSPTSSLPKFNIYSCRYWVDECRIDVYRLAGMLNGQANREDPRLII